MAPAATSSDDAGQPAAAIDAPDAVTIACRGAALAKCVEWGYRPWATRTTCQGSNCTQVSLKDHHQSCTRMVRADYCGTGTPHTITGTPIDLFDRLNPAVQAEATRTLSSWSVEAEWGPNGALCVGDELRLQMFDDLGIAYTHPSCLDSIDDFSNCGTPGNPRGAKLVNKYCYKWMDEPGACAGNKHVN